MGKNYSLYSKLLCCKSVTQFQKIYYTTANEKKRKTLDGMSNPSLMKARWSMTWILKGEHRTTREKRHIHWYKYSIFNERRWIHNMNSERRTAKGEWFMYSNFIEGSWIPSIHERSISWKLWTPNDEGRKGINIHGNSLFNETLIPTMNS